MELFRKITPHLYIAVVLSLIFILLGSAPPTRVGDGGEYYALFYAWYETYRPWMTPASFDAYINLYASDEIANLTPREFFEWKFSALKVGETADFNHFWFYSFAAFWIAKLFSAAGIFLGPHPSFLLLHLFLLIFTTSVSFSFHKWPGVLALSIITIASPLLWFFDKVHTELFTCCVSLSALILVSSKKYLPGALLLALASTQNPSFALTAIIPLAYRIILEKSRRYDLMEVCLIASTVLAILAHPVYYFCRFGVVTPQLLAGGASLGGHLSSAYIWLVDPDLGLLPNWPLGLVSILLGIFIYLSSARQTIGRVDKLFFWFLVGFLFVNFYAHSSTTNLNSGGTSGIARYALWYLPLAYPIALYVFSNFPLQRILCYPLISAIVCLSLFSITENHPAKIEQNSRPTSLSWFIQEAIPWFYNPPPEVFAERFSGSGDHFHLLKLRGVLGPDCRKLLIYPDPSRNGISFSTDCGIDQSKLNIFAAALAAGAPKEFYTYIGSENFSSTSSN